MALIFRQISASSGKYALRYASKTKILGRTAKTVGNVSLKM